MLTLVPRHPSNNPSLPNGIYDAVIKYVTHGEYANDSHYVSFVFWLPDQGKHLVTNFYFPNGQSIKTQQRLWNLCAMVGLELVDVLEEPKRFEDRRLKIKTRKVDPVDSDASRSYSDVALFLPAQIEDPVSRAESVSI